MEALNRIKKGVADTIQKADDEIRDRARREAERQVNGSRGASSSNGARSIQPTGARPPVGTIVAHGAQVARSSRNDAADVDVELVVTTMRSELDETRRRLDDFDARLERRLTEALATLQDVAAAQTRDGVDALVREEVRRVLLSENEASSLGLTENDAPSVSPVMSLKQKLDQKKLETFEAATRAAETTGAPVVANVGKSPSADASAAEGLDAKAAAAVKSSEVPSWIAESLRALEARVAAAEAAAAAAMASTARLERENDETDASDVSRGASLAEDAPLRSTNSERFPDELSETVPERTELEALRDRLEEVAEMAFSSAAAAARAEVRAEEERLAANSRGRKERSAADPETKNVIADDVEALRGEVRKLSEVSGSAANAEHVAFAAVESSKLATEKLDELSGTVAELAEALEAARRELRESEARGFSQKTKNEKTKNAAAERAKSSEFEKRVSDVTTRLEDLERRDANRSASENARALRETRDAEAKESAARDAEAAAKARFDETDASLASVSAKLASVARNVDDRIATIRLACETELVAVMRTFETRLELVETRVLHENSYTETAERVSRLEARLAETMTLAESALRRADARDTRDAMERERVAETFASDVQNLTKAVETIARESTDTKSLAEDSARRASERARETALAEARQTERAVWDTVMLLSAEVASANRRGGTPGSSFRSGTRLPRFGGTAGAGTESLSVQTRVGAEGSTPRIRGVPVAGTPAGPSSPASSGGAKRFLGIRRLFKSPRNDVPDGETDEQGNER